MSIKWFSSKKHNNMEQSQGVRQKSKPWLSVFMLLFTLLLTVGFVKFKDDILLADKYTFAPSYSLSTLKPHITNATVVTVSKRTVKSETEGSKSYQFTSDTGYKLLLLSFQEKEVYTVGDSLETTIDDEFPSDMQLLSGYTVTAKFEDLAYRDGMEWGSLGKIYAEYGTLGLTGVNGENKQSLISDIIEKDFPDASLDTVSNIELLNGLAYRSNVITSDLVNRSLIYVPRDAAVFDNTLDKSADYWRNASEENSYIFMAPFMYALINKQANIGMNPDMNKSIGNTFTTFTNFNENPKSLANAMLTAFNANKTYEEKKQAATYIQNAVAFAWPVLVNSAEGTTESFGPLMSSDSSRKGDEYTIEVAPINPEVTAKTKDVNNYWKSPFISSMYYVEDTLHKYSASEDTYLDTVTALLDSDEDYLKKYKSGPLDEDALHEDLALYYAEHPDMAYAVLDAVFGNIKEYPILMPGAFTIGNYEIPKFYNYRYAVGHTEYIDFEKALLDWLAAGIDNYDEKDVERDVRVAGIRQAQLNCALGYILQERHKGINIDTQSNIEIRIIDVYSNQGNIDTAESDDDGEYSGADYARELRQHIEDSGWGAWDIILGLPNTGYCTTYETLASNFYDFETISDNRTKVTTFASASLMYAKNYKFGIPTADGEELIVGNAGNKSGNLNDVVIDALNALGNKKFRISKYLTSDTYTDIWRTAGIDTAYPLAFNYTKEKANLALTDTMRQAYLSTLYSRGTSAAGNLDQIFNYVGLINIGFARDTASLYTAFTGFHPQQLGVTRFQGSDQAKYYAESAVEKVGMSKYAITFSPNLPDDESFYGYKELKFNGKTVKLSSSNLGNAFAKSSYATKWTRSQSFTTAAGSFALRAIYKGNHARLIVEPITNTNGKDYSIDTSYVGVFPTKLNDDQLDNTYVVNADRLAVNNYASNYVYKTAFTTYSPTTDTIGTLNEEEPELIERAQNNTTCANGYFAYLYNRCFYKKSDTIEVHAVLGFREKTSSEMEITHECAPTKVHNYNMVLGVNFSKAALDALSEQLTDDNKRVAYLTVALGGIDNGKLAYFDYDGTSVKPSQFDSSLLAEEEKPILSPRDFGQIKFLYNDWCNELANTKIQAQLYNEWGNRKLSAQYDWSNVSGNSSNKTGSTVTIEITKAQIDEWLKDDKYASDTTFHKSDTEFMMVVKEWPADFFAGQKANRLATVESSDKLAVNTDYTFGVECQLSVVNNLETGSQTIYSITAYDNGKFDIANPTIFTNLGTGLYSGLYASTVAKMDELHSSIIAVRDLKLMPNRVLTPDDYLEQNIEYGEGTDNHVYFKFSQPEIKQWQFSGKASLRWVKSENPKLATIEWKDGDRPALGDTITSTMNIEFDGGKTTIKEFYDTLKNEGVEYIIISISENSLNSEDSYDPKNKSSKSSKELIGDLRDLTPGSKGMTNALQQFNAGSIVYTLDEFIELIGGKESEDTNGSLQILDKYINTQTASLLANDPDNGRDTTQAGANEFDANRLEFSFIASIYGAGANATLSAAAKTEDKQVGTYLTTLATIDSTPLFDLTNGLGYILTPMSTADFQNTKDNIRFNTAINKEVANLRLKYPGENIVSTDTMLYKLLAENTDYVVWTHQTAEEGSGYQVKSASAFEGTGLRDKQASIISLGDDKKPDGDAWVAAICSAEKPPEAEPRSYIVRTSSPIAYTQIKNGTWTAEEKAEQTWNTLTGIPSTEKFYISSGGSEFIVEMRATEVVYERAYRSYISHFAQNDCKFKPSDIASAGGGSVTSVNKSNISHDLNVTSSVGTLTDKFTLPAPVGYSSASYTVSAHGGNTITATWTGTIENTTANPGIQHIIAPVDLMGVTSDTASVSVSSTGNGWTESKTITPGTWYSGYPGEMTNKDHPNKQHLAGTEGGTYSWNVTNYNKAVDQAYTWAKALETASDGAGNVIITSNSDQKVRSWHIGDAVINITLTNVNSATNAGAKVTLAHEGKGLPKTTYTTDDVTKMAYTGGGGGAKLETNDDTLSSGWFEVYGSKEQFYGASSCKPSSAASVLGQTGRPVTQTFMDEPSYLDFLKNGAPDPYNMTDYNHTGSYTCEVDGDTHAGYTHSSEPEECKGKYPATTWCGFNNNTYVAAVACSASQTSSTASGHADCGPCPGHGTDEEGNPNPCDATHTHFAPPSCNAVAHTCYSQHTCSASHSNGGYKQTTLKQSGTVSYKIVVTFKDSYTQGDQKVTTPGGNYPKHSCCGPCCEHVLPAISDEWVQWISYSTVRISDIRVNKISRSYVEGQNDITLDMKNDPYLIGNIKEGDVNVFYNIATENATYNKSVYTDHGGYHNLAGSSVLPDEQTVVDGVSLAGRVRYSLQSQQHDKVLWNEYNQLNQAKRTSECDGQASKTVAAHYNPSPDGGRGHEEWWALGILYRRSNSASDVYYNGAAKQENQYNTKFTHADNWLEGSGDGQFNTAVIQSGSDKTGYTNNSVDARDKATWEYLRFVERRNTINTVNVMTDTLIFQGTQQGDYSLLYKVRTSVGKTAEQDHDKDKDGLKIELPELFPGTPQNPRTYAYLGQGPDLAEDVPYQVLRDISNAGSIMYGGYNGRGGDDELRTHSTLGTAYEITTLLDSNNSVYDVSTTHPDAKANVAGPLTYTTVTTVTDSLNPALFKTSAALYQHRLTRPTTSLRIGQLDIQIDPTMQNKLHTTEKATQTWFQIINYTEPKAKGSDEGGNYDYTIAKEYYAANSNIGGNDVFAQESYYYGTTNTGYLDPMFKVNDVIIHTPISSSNNKLLQDVDFYDQRHDTVNLSHENNTKGCPSSALLCEYSYFDCSYLEEKVLFNMNFDTTYSRVDSTGSVTTGRTFAEDTYGYITTITETANFVVVPVKAGLVTRINPASYGTGININGTTLNIPLNTIGAQYTTGTKIKIAVQGSFSANTSVFKCGNVTATMISNGIKISNGKAAYVFNFNNATEYHNYELVIDYDGLDKFTLTVDGKNVNKSASTPAPDDLNVQFTSATWADTMYFGERCKLYNLQVVHLPGTATCTDGCYDNKFECQQLWNYTCDTATKYTGTSLPHKYTASVEGTYLIELYDGAGNYQSQKIHLDKGESIYAYLGSKGYWSYSGTDKGSTSSTTKEYVDRQTGVETGKILNPATLVLDKSTGKGSITLTPGVYYLEAAGDAGTAGKGGKATGWLTVKETTTYYWNADQSAWINSSNSSTNANVLGGKGAVQGQEASYDFAYTGGIQSVDLPAGTYTLEVWGAQGGSGYYSGGNGYSAGNYYGGYGGYSKGDIVLNTASTLYIAVGGAGKCVGYGANVESFNGGGACTNSSTNIGYGSSGGGATHIATVTGELYTLDTNRDKILIVAGGGGGADGNQGTYQNAGHGGGTSGGHGGSAVDSYATQTSGYAFGKGQSSGSSPAGAGGGGYYGGYMGNSVKAGTGGSGYLSSSLNNASTTAGINGTTSSTTALAGKAKITGTSIAAQNAVASSYYNVEQGTKKDNVSNDGYVRIYRYVDASANDGITKIENTYGDATFTDSIVVNPLNPTEVVFNNNTTTSTTLTPGIYLLEAIDEKGKGVTGIYHTLTNTTLYHGNSTSGHWINTSNSATNPLVLAKQGTDAVYEYTDMTRSAYDDDGGSGYNCSMTASLSEGTYVLCNGTFSAMRQMTTYKDGDNLGTINCTFNYKINGTSYTMSGSGSVSFTVPAGQTWVVSCSTNNSAATSQSIDPYTAVFKAGTKTLVTPEVPGTYTANNVKNPNTAYTTTDSARTRITRLASLADLSNLTGVTYDTPSKTTVSNIIATCSVPGKTITSCKITCMTEVKVSTKFTNYTYQADTSKIILSNAGGAPIVLEYTGNVQAVTLEPGTYRLEAWGASGGGAGNGRAGEGGYTAGTVTFDKTTTIYVYVGQQGNGTVHGQYGLATFNGGGAGFRNGADSVTHNGTSGGGATDIRVTDGIWYNDASLKSRILVAGGGGGYGCASAHNPGHGGGLVGATTLNSSGSYIGASASGGSQTAPGKGVGVYAATYGAGEGKFGIGATGEQCAAGGGGGYYGGGTEYTAGGGGGSSYVSGYAGCDTTYLANQKVDGKNLAFKDVVLQQGGNIGNGRVRITKVGVSSSAKYETAISDGYTWVKVFSHDTSAGFFNTNEVLHTGNPTSLKYSILDEIDLLRTAHESKYVFKLYYPETGQTNIWKQSYKPQDENITDGTGTKDVTGYEPIRIDMNGNYWGGLAKSTTSATFIDGSINHGNWYYAIGAHQQWGTGERTIPGGDNTSVNKVELWVATDLDKITTIAGSSAGASGDHILNSTVTTTTSCPVESPYYWFLLGQKNNVAQIRLVHDTHDSTCSKVQNSNNYHTHSTSCIGGNPAYDYLLYAAQHNLPELDSLCKTYLGVSKSSLGNVYNTLLSKNFDLTLIPETVDGYDNPILGCYNHNSEHVHNVTCETTNRTSICNNIHHKGKHYDFGHPLCYEPCKDNEKHNPTKVQIDGEDLYIGSAMNLNGYFTVYWDNLGDFYDTGDVGSYIPTSEKGQGYEDGMDTTRWLKRKVIIFNDIDVLFYDETQNTWTLHRAGTEINLPIVTDGDPTNGDDDVKRDWRNANQTPITTYSFYCLLNNNEYSKTAFQAWTEGLNSPSSEGQGNKPYDKLQDRHVDLTAESNNFYRNERNSNPPFSALHSTKHYHLFDVVGQIGNMIITYTTDPRWSNFFKQANPSAGWQVENLLYEIVPDQQERYLYIGREENGTFKDIRNHAISSTNRFFDTWNTESWKYTAVPINSILEPDLLAAQTNYVWSKLAEDLKCGYDIYCEITTTGDYEALDVEYKYYAFDRDTGEVSEVDLWSKVDSSFLAYYLADEDATQIQQIIDQDSLGGYYGIESTKSLALYHLYVDLSTEQGLRMVTPEQMIETTTLSKELDKTVEYRETPYINEEGELDYVVSGIEVEGEGLSLEQIGIGTAYGVSVDSRTRILSGSSYDNWGLRDYSNGVVNFSYPRTIMDTNLESQINPSEFTTQARRWLFTAGLAENTVAVKFDGTTHVDLTTQSTHENIITDYDRYAILIGVNIKARGKVWFLDYEAFSTPQRVLGKNLDPKYPDIIAVYGLSSKEDDFDVEQSH